MTQRNSTGAAVLHLSDRSYSRRFSQPLPFYLPVALVTVLVISVLLLRAGVPRWARAVLVALYLVFIVGGYFVSQTDALGMLD